MCVSVWRHLHPIWVKPRAHICSFSRNGDWKWSPVIFVYRIALNSVFSFSLTGCITKVTESSLSQYLTREGERIVRWIPLPRVLTQYEIIRKQWNISSSLAVEKKVKNFAREEYLTDVEIKTFLKGQKSKIWTRVAMSISNNDNHYTTSVCISISSHKN